MRGDLKKILNADLKGKKTMKFIPAKSLSGNILYLPPGEISDFHKEVFGDELESDLEPIDFFLYAGQEYSD
jgi:hypothetical protein